MARRSPTSLWFQWSKMRPPRDLAATNEHPYDPGMSALLDLRMHSGSRQFGALPQVLDWYATRDQVARLRGARLTGFVCDGVTEAWIDFTYAGHAFSINDQFGEYWFFVDDPACPDEVLHAVLGHFEGERKP